MKKTKISTRVLEIPDEVFFEIMKYADHVSLFNFILSNREFHRIFTIFHPVDLDVVRLAYLNRPMGGGMKDDHLGRLINLFIQSQSFIPQEIKTRDFKSFMTKFVEKSKSPINRIIIEEMFKFNEESGKSHFVVAGGFVLSVLRDVFPSFKKDEVNDCERGVQDIDVFVLSYDRKPVDIQQCLAQVLIGAEERISKETEMKFIFCKTESSITIHSDDIEEEDKKKIPRFSIPLQIVLRQVDCVEELLCLFDIDCCRFAVDGMKLYTTYEGRRSLQVKKNFCAPIDRYKLLYKKRVQKYGNRGIITLFKNIHPLSGYFSEVELKRLLPEDEGAHYTLHRKSYDNVVNYFDVGLYSATFGCTYTELKELFDMGFSRYMDTYDSFAVDPDLYNNRNIELELRNRFNYVTNFMETTNLVLLASFRELFTLQSSMFFAGKYDEKHLYEKYDIVRCVECGIYYKIHYCAKLCECKFCRKILDEYDRCERGIEKHKKTRKVTSGKQFCSNCAMKLKSIEMDPILKICGLAEPFDKSNCTFVIFGGRTNPGYEIARYLLDCLYNGVPIQDRDEIIVTTRFPEITFNKYAFDQNFITSGSLRICALNLCNDDETSKFLSSWFEKLKNSENIVFLYMAHSEPDRRKFKDMKCYYQGLKVQKREVEKKYHAPLLEVPYYNYVSRLLSKMKLECPKQLESLRRGVLKETNLVNNVVPQEIFRRIFEFWKAKGSRGKCFIVRLSSSRTKDTDDYVKRTAQVYRNYDIHHISVNVERWFSKPDWKHDLPYSPEYQSSVILSKLFTRGHQLEGNLDT